MFYSYDTQKILLIISEKRKRVIYCNTWEQIKLRKSKNIGKYTAIPELQTHKGPSIDYYTVTTSEIPLLMKYCTFALM